MVVLASLTLNDSFHELSFILNLFLMLLTLSWRCLLVLLDCRRLDFQVKRKCILDDDGHLYANVPSLFEFGRLNEDHAKLLLVVYEKLLLLYVTLLVKVADSERRGPNVLTCTRHALCLLIVLMRAEHDLGQEFQVRQRVPITWRQLNYLLILFCSR